MTQERRHVRIEKNNISIETWDMSIDITYFVLDILQVVISRSTYYISFERMCLTDNGENLVTTLAPSILTGSSFFLAGNRDNYKNFDGFEFGLYPTKDL